MRYYFAPLEGLTDSVYRRLHHQYFPGIDRYYTPFLSPTVHRALTPRESRELPPADTLSYSCVPQLLTKVPADFLWMAQQCAELGYREVNLNLGCPSGTVTAKGKGAGMLTDPQSLDRFLDAVYSAAPLDISIKTRLGFYSPEEFPHLLEIFNRYPVKELIIHPRVRQDFYHSPVDLEAFSYAVKNSKHPVCYNGNLCSTSQVRAFQEKFPQVEAVMIGRGLIGDPGMLTPDGTSVSVLSEFYDELFETYQAIFGSSRNAMFRLKENWRYLLCHFQYSDKLGKRLRKAKNPSEYTAITKEIFDTLSLLPELAADW